MIRVHTYQPRNTFIDTTRPWLIRIGDHVKITRGVTLLTHGYDWSVLKGVYGEVLGSSGGVNWRQCIYRYAINYSKRRAYWK